MRAGFAASTLTATELWLRHVALGGSAGEAEVLAMVSGLAPVTRFEHDTIAVVLNEHFDDEGFAVRVAYHRADLGRPRPVAASSAWAREYLTQLPHTFDAPGIARRYLREHADGLPESLAQDAEVLVSELVTNAVEHGRPVVFLQLTLTATWLEIVVTDQGDRNPQQQQPDPTTATGRGLQIVDRLATRWGVMPIDPGPGKMVWFQCSAD